MTINKTGDGSGILSPNTNTATVNYGDNLTVTATPEACSTFVGWSGDASGTGNAVLTNITSDKNIIATFNKKKFIITASMSGNGSGTLSHSTQEVICGGSLTVIATPDACSEFGGWTGDASGTGNAILTDIQSDKTIIASFAKKQYIVTISKNGNGGGSLSQGTQTVMCGDSLTVSAFPDGCSEFAGWGGAASGTGQAALSDIQSNLSLIANFEKKEYTVALYQVGNELLSRDIKKELGKTKAEFLVLKLDDHLVHIPWELICLGDEFLCRRFNMGRMVKTRQKVAEGPERVMTKPYKMWVVSNPGGDLSGAGSEGLEICGIMDELNGDETVMDASLDSDVGP